jgi:hypothetical protein
VSWLLVLLIGEPVVAESRRGVDSHDEQAEMVASSSVATVVRQRITEVVLDIGCLLRGQISKLNPMEWNWLRECSCGHLAERHSGIGRKIEA